MNIADVVLFTDDNWLFAAWLISGFIGCLIGNYKNRRRLGLYLGLLWGPIGWIVMMFVDECAPGETGNGLAIGVIATAIPVALFFGSKTLIEWENGRGDREAWMHDKANAENPVTTPAPQRSTWNREEMFVVHGKVIGATTEGVTVDCTGPDYGGFDTIRVDAGAGAAASRNLAAMAREHEVKTYGPLLSTEGGAAAPANWQPEKNATGRIELRGLQKQTGETVHVIAAPLGGSIYTLRYSFPDTRKAEVAERAPATPIPALSSAQQREAILRKYGAH